MTSHKPATAADFDKVIQENEDLRKENLQLKHQLDAAKEILKPKWKEAGKLLQIFGEPDLHAESKPNGDPLERFRPLLEKAPREAIRKIADTLAAMGGRATMKQLESATGYKATSVLNAVGWLKQNLVAGKEGTEVVLSK